MPCFVWRASSGKRLIYRLIDTHTVPNISINRRITFMNWSTILSIYPICLSFSWAALLCSLPITRNKNRLVLKALTLFGISVLLYSHFAYSTVKEEILVTPLVGMVLAIIAISEPTETTQPYQNFVCSFLAGAAITMCLFAVFSTFKIYQ